jgi:hypothetical protein
VSRPDVALEGRLLGIVQDIARRAQEHDRAKAGEVRVVEGGGILRRLH